MTDNKLRCALVYRLEGGGSSEVTLLAKYDHAAEVEAGELYGSRDKSYSDAVGMVIANDPPSGVADENTIGGFKVVQSDVHQVIYGADSEGLCLAVITGKKYASRAAIKMLQDLYTPYSEQFGLQAKSATNGSLTKKSKSLLASTCKKFDDSSKVDKAAALNVKVEEVKLQMQDNIASMLKNTEQAESLAERSSQLNEQAHVFQKKSKDLKKQMRCKNIKMTIILVSLVVGILIIILVPLIVRAKQAAKLASGGGGTGEQP
ncbi:hypothetical protein ACHAXS_004913 [Conticribra weissflogii]